MDNAYIKHVLFEVVNDVQSGKSFSEAIKKHDTVFGRLFVALMRSAEESGSMTQILGYLSTYLEKSVRLNQKIRSIPTRRSC